MISSLIDRLNNTVTRQRRSDTTKMGLIMNTAGMFSIALVIIHGWHTFAKISSVSVPSCNVKGLDMKHHLSLTASLVTDLYKLVATGTIRNRSSCKDSMDEGIVVPVSNDSPNAPSSEVISYAFVVSVSEMHSGRVVSLRLQDICEPDGSDPKLTSITCAAIYAAVNKQLDDIHVTPTSHSLSSSSRYISNDDQLQSLLGFEGEYDQLFRLYLDRHPDASVNHPAVLDLPSDIFIPQFMVGSLVTTHQPNSPSVSDPADQFPAIRNVSGLTSTPEGIDHPANSSLPDLGGQYLHSQDASPSLPTLVDPTGKRSDLRQSPGISPPVKRHPQFKSLEGQSPMKRLKQASYVADLDPHYEDHISLDSESITSDSDSFIGEYEEDDAEELNDDDIDAFMFAQKRNIINQFM